MSQTKRLTRNAFEAAYRKALKKFSSRDNVTGVDIGEQYIGGKKMRRLAIRIHVREKLDELVIDPKELLPREIDGVPIDVIEAVYEAEEGLRGRSPRRMPLNPIQPGISVSHVNTQAGTIGAIVFDLRTGHPCVLSNWHVLAGSMQAQPGDSIVQPGSFDGGRNPKYAIGKLARRILNQSGDAAIAPLNKRRKIALEQYGTNLIITQARMPKKREILTKSGRSTNSTEARVEGIGLYKIRYRGVGLVSINGFKLVPTRRGNPRNEEISEEGDSGAIWYAKDTGEGVGLNFAGETSSLPIKEHALACFLPDVLDELGVSLVPTRPENAEYNDVDDLFDYELEDDCVPRQ